MSMSPCRQGSPIRLFFPFRGDPRIIASRLVKHGEDAQKKDPIGANHLFFSATIAYCLSAVLCNTLDDEEVQFFKHWQRVSDQKMRSTLMEIFRSCQAASLELGFREKGEQKLCHYSRRAGILSALFAIGRPDPFREEEYTELAAEILYDEEEAIRFMQTVQCVRKACKHLGFRPYTGLDKAYLVIYNPRTPWKESCDRP